MRIEINNDIVLAKNTALYISRTARDHGISDDHAVKLGDWLTEYLSERMKDIDDRFPEMIIESATAEDEIIISITDRGRPYILTDSQKESWERAAGGTILQEYLLNRGQKLSVIIKTDSADRPSPLDIKSDGAGKPSSLDIKSDGAGRTSRSDAYVKDELLDKEFTCRLLEDDPEDMTSALGCIHSHYGYNYIHQYIYDADHFHEILSNGRYVAAVAENEHKQVMGYGALDAHPWFPGLMEMGGLVVNPIARGLGLGDMLDDYRIEFGKTLGLRGLFSTPIMPNPVSQKLLTRHGYIPTGIHFHAGGPESLGSFGDGIHPMDCGFCVYIYDKDTLHTIYPPDECREFLRDVLDEVGINYEFKDPGDTAYDKENTNQTENSCTGSVVYYNNEAVHKLLEVRFDSLGDDYRERVMELPLSKDDLSVEAVMMLIDMNDPRCPEFYDFLRDNGFIFTGCVPGGETDLIVMEYLKYKVDRNSIVTEPDYEEMLERIYTLNNGLI